MRVRDVHEARLLMVDDEPELRRMLLSILHGDGYADVHEAATAAEALEKARQLRPDAVILDVMLPDGDGFSLLRELRAFTQAPVLFLSARDEDEARLRGLGLGADDYITKPFRIRELTSRIRSVLRRAGQGGSTLMEFGPVQINAALGKVYKNGQDVFLSALEYRLLMTLANHAGQVLSRNQLLESIWDVSGDFVNDNTLTVYIKRLREKIEDDPQNPVVIETARGLGYRVGGRR